MPLTTQGGPNCHTLPVMRVKLVSDPDVCSDFDIGILPTPQERAPVPAYCHDIARNEAGSVGEIAYSCGLGLTEPEQPPTKCMRFVHRANGIRNSSTTTPGESTAAPLRESISPSHLSKAQGQKKKPLIGVRLTHQMRTPQWRSQLGSTRSKVSTDPLIHPCEACHWRREDSRCLMNKNLAIIGG